MENYVLIEKFREKKCTKCNEVFPATLEYFYKQKNGLYKLRPTCKNCTNLLRKIFHNKNKEKDNETNRLWYHNNKKYRIEQIKEYRENNPEKVEKWIEEYTPTLIDRRKERRETDIIFKLKHTISNGIRRSFKVKNLKKESNTTKILGCSYEEFKLYIESQFEPWMNWGNYGVYNPNGERTWQIDHFIPIDTAKTVEDVIMLNHYKNLRPLCSLENLKKHNKIIPYPEILQDNLQ